MIESGATQYQMIAGPSTSRSPRSNSFSDFSYEHFPIVCPTCQGTGDIEDDSTDMITFVPVKDERLRPAWIKVKVCILLFSILLIGGITTYLLYPRDVTIDVESKEVTDFNFKTKHPWLFYNLVLKIKNNNFVSVKLLHITVELFYARNRVATKTIERVVSVDLRSVKKEIILLNATYTNAAAGNITWECYNHRYCVYQLILSSADVSHWMNSQRIESKDNYFCIDCGSMIFPLPIKTTTKHPSMTKHATAIASKPSTTTTKVSTATYHSTTTSKHPIDMTNLSTISTKCLTSSTSKLSTIAINNVTAEEITTMLPSAVVAVHNDDNT